MRKDGAGQRWGLIEEESLKKHDLARLRTGSAPLEQIFQRPGEKPFTIRLTFLSSRPELARVLANAFWIVYQNGKRRATLIAAAHSLRLFTRFLDHRKKSQRDVRIRETTGAGDAEGNGDLASRQTAVEKEVRGMHTLNVLLVPASGETALP